MRDLKDKVAVVTGAGGGIGTALVKRFAQEGVKVAAFDIDLDAAESAVKSAQEEGGEAAAYEVDITDHDAVAAAVERAADRFGGIDILVNNAGWDMAKPFLQTEPDLWAKIIAINLTGPINLHHAVLPKLIERGGGRIVNISSDAGRVGSSGEAIYAACKGGIVAFTKTIAREHARDNVRANTVCPGPTETPLFDAFLGESEYSEKIYKALERSIPLKRLGKPEDMPGIVAFLASADADYITGQVISVSGGLTMAG